MGKRRHRKTRSPPDPVTIHLIKLAVGVDDVDHLRALQAARRQGQGEVVHVTRQHPKRIDELLYGGSIYWVIRGAVRARQALLDLRSQEDDEGRKKCVLVLEPTLIETLATPHRAFQGWRYLHPEKAPADGRGGTLPGALPSELAKELKDLGLL